MIPANQRCLTQALSMLEALSDDQYAVARGDWSAVGAQYRHVLEHYQCLLEGVESARVDYDARRRDETIERSRHRAREVTIEVIGALAELDRLSEDRPLLVQMQCDSKRSGPMWSRSSLGRELQFLVSHTVHHFALIKMLVAQQSVRLDPEFGIAPSTLSHARAVR